VKIKIASEEWSIDQAAAVCSWYGDAVADTLTYYDFAGTDTDPHAHNQVDLTDAGRLVVINARLDADDVPFMIRRGETAPWEAVSFEDDLLDVDWLNLLDRAEQIYRHFRPNAGPRLGPTRTHKLLHLKRPHVFPIIDSVVRETYRERARAQGNRYWPVLAQEIQDNREAYGALARRLTTERVGRLTVPRLHDILVWSLHGRRQKEARGVATSPSR
jgi:hypothetical protein